MPDRVLPMPTALHDVGRSGRLEMCFRRKRNRTVLDHLYSETPFKVTRLHHSDRSDLAHLILMHTTAGVFGGDTLSVDIRVESGARIMITSQSATKVHPGGDRPASQELRIRVEAGGELHYYADPFIPFAGSRFHQRTRVELESDSRFYAWDGLMSGRVARPEKWCFDQLRIETSVDIDSTPAYLDRFLIHPESRVPIHSLTMGPFDYLGTYFIHDSCVDAALCEAVRNNLTVDSDQTRRGTDNPCPGLLVGRAVSRGGTLFREMRTRFVKAVFKEVLGQPFSGPRGF